MVGNVGEPPLMSWEENKSNLGLEWCTRLRQLGRGGI